MNIQGVHALYNQPKAEDSSATTGSSSSTSTSSSSNTLNANSFITLLTAQLQAQDPTNPMDPDQMMSELVSMNSLQQLIGIKQDLDSLTGTTTSSGSSSSSTTASSGTG